MNSNKSDYISSIEILLNELRDKSHIFFKDSDNFFKDSEKLTYSHFLIDEEFGDLMSDSISIVYYNNRLIILENKNILFIVKVNNDLDDIKYKKWINLIRLVLGCLTNKYFSYTETECRLVIKELMMINNLLN